MIKPRIEIRFGDGDVKMMACTNINEYPDAIAVCLKNGESRPIGTVVNDPAFGWEPEESDMVWIFKDVASLRNVTAWLESVACTKEARQSIKDEEKKDDQT